MLFFVLFRIMDLNNRQEQDKIIYERCRKIYHNRINLNQHPCDKCNKKFSSSKKLQNHVNRCFKSHTCEFCKKMFRSPATLQKHLCLFCQTCKRLYASHQVIELHKCNVRPRKIRMKKLILMKHDSKTVSCF